MLYYKSFKALKIAEQTGLATKDDNVKTTLNSVSMTIQKRNKFTDATYCH